MIVWDKIITSAQKANIKESNEHVKYSLVDQGADLRLGQQLCCNLSYRLAKIVCIGERLSL